MKLLYGNGKEEETVRGEPREPGDIKEEIYITGQRKHYGEKSVGADYEKGAEERKEI